MTKTTRVSSSVSRSPEGASGSPVALVSGGGSGGHVFPGLAVAEQLIGRGWRVDWAGDGSGIEATLVAEHGHRFHDLPARRFVGRGVWQQVRALATMAVSAGRARRLISRLNAAVVVGTGGFASVPAVVGGWLAARPIFLVEPNSTAGLANRILSRVASEAAVGDTSTSATLRCPSNVTGIPIRKGFAETSAALPPPGPPFRVLVLGGSQGAREINEVVPAALAMVSAELGTIEVLHQCGVPMVEQSEKAYENEANGLLDATVVPFIANVASELERAHLAISRAGAITLAELCAVGRPAILLPLAAAAGHQLSNARRAEAAGAARLFEEKTGVSLSKEVSALLGDRSALETMAKASRALGRADGAERVADRVEALAHAWQSEHPSRSAHRGDRR